MLGNATVTLVQRVVTGQDRYGNDVTSETRSAVSGCAVWPAQSTEDTQGRDVITDTLECLFPPGSVVGAVDRVEVNGKSYEITGTAFDWTSPLSGTRVGVQANLKAVTG